MSRFFRFSRIRPAELYRERLRQLRRAAALSFALLPVIAALLLLGERFLPRGTQAATSGDEEPLNPSAFTSLPAPAPEDGDRAADWANPAALAGLQAPQLPSPDAALPLSPTTDPASTALSAPPSSSRLAELSPLPIEASDTEPRSTETNDSEPPLTDAALDDLLSLVSAPAAPVRSSPPLKSTEGSAPSETTAPFRTRPGRSAAGAATQGTTSRIASASATAGGADEAPDTPPRYREAPPPPYPAAMRAGHYRGEVVVLIEVGADGLPKSVSILRSAGREELDRTARDWILSHWSFYPAERDGRRVASRVRTSIRFAGR